ncbi:MAG: hypothetical protein M3P24_00140 [Gemmatimonadota bacterium]|nr:hypothetical protein [Gemmatimonadota bacterium]
MLHRDGSWSVRYEQELFFYAAPSRARVLETGGRYVVQEGTAGRLVLNLYPNDAITADRPGIAVLNGDTLAYGPGVFVR